MARLDLARSGPWIGFGGLAVLLWIYLASGLFAPWWAVVGMVGVWVGLLVLAIGWARPRPHVVAVLPFVGLALWVGVVWVGDGWLGWSG